ncbi:hypothetical protein AQ925_15015 [Burkholderia pseudomallei]|nr:hypothetical protein BGI47_18375 [Burkholderia pseudomallei]KGW19271.1 transposase domain protein [Burkholderia pseudomallei MSHR4303]APZ26908.1 hypothetical protein BGI46_18375 [Burkholderia pseudomallei]OMW54990.1 hypothetical protein AQ810_30390 [Burkholderia pseudomallei]OMZ37732.1 hypothetical protein AQ862_03050 [Burkholderia pseudomallei]
MLAKTLEQAAIPGDIQPEIAVVNRDYKGVAIDGVKVYHPGLRRSITHGLPATIRLRSESCYIDVALAAPKDRLSREILRSVDPSIPRVRSCLELWRTTLLGARHMIEVGNDVINKGSNLGSQVATTRICHMNIELWMPTIAKEMHEATTRDIPFDQIIRQSGNAHAEYRQPAQHLDVVCNESIERLTARRAT